MTVNVKVAYATHEYTVSVGKKGPEVRRATGQLMEHARKRRKTPCAWGGRSRPSWPVESRQVM